MVKLTLVRGIPGSGKSTYAKTLPAKHLEADMAFVHPDGVYRFDRTKLGDAHNWCISSAREYLKAGEDVVVSNTFTTLNEIKSYLAMATYVGGIEVEVVRCSGEWGS